MKGKDFNAENAEYAETEDQVRKLHLHLGSVAVYGKVFFFPSALRVLCV